MTAVRDLPDLDSPHFTSDLAIGNRFRSDAFVLAAITFVSYLTLSWQFTGPIYLMDEIGYLANAAALSGRSIDAASSYYFGYSLFLLPGFLLFDEPTIIWRAVLVTNAFLFAGAMFLLHRISGVLSNDRLTRIFAVGLCALYPAYPTMAGYAFSTPAIVLVFVAACWTLCQSVLSPAQRLSLFALLVGFLTWIHPTGVSVAIAAVLTLGLMSWLDRRLIAPAIAAVLIITLMILAYQQVLQPLLRDAMTSEGFQPKLHYPTIAEEIGKLFSPGGALEFLTRYLALISYVLIGSLALTGGAAAYIIRRVVTIRRDCERGDGGTVSFLVFALLSLLGVVGLSVLFFTKPDQYHTHFWMHGRYIEGVLAPILLIAFVVGVSRLGRIAVASGVFLPVIVLYMIIGQETGFVEEVDLSALWPQVIYPGGSVLFWLIMGWVACTASVFFSNTQLKFVLASVYICCIGNQVLWHHQSTEARPYSPDLYKLITDLEMQGGCIAFTPSVKQVPRERQFERLNQISFYLMNSDFRRMDVADWIENCDGPYLTYRDDPALAEAGALLVAQELFTGLKVYAREFTNGHVKGFYKQIFVRREHDGRSATHSARVTASDLSGHLGVGELIDGSIVSNNRSGHVFFGPYGYLDAGRYRFHAFGYAGNVGESWFDLVSEGGSRIHHTFPLQETEAGQDHIASGAFVILEDMKNFEIRLNADANANIVFSHYELELLAD